MNSEHIEAAKQGMTVRVYRLQEKLRRLPLNPRSDALRNTRTHLSANLIRLARLDKCVSKINPMAGTLD
jgi:hypothetical protein